MTPVSLIFLYLFALNYLNLVLIPRAKLDVERATWKGRFFENYNEYVCFSCYI